MSGRALWHGRCAAVLAAVVWLGAVPALARSSDAAPSHEDDALGECVGEALELIEEQGGRRRGEPTVGFLTEGRSRTLPIALERDGCVGLLAVGHDNVQDLDIMLHTASGIALERDASIDPYSYVRYCGARGLQLMATVHMYKGRGEYRLVQIIDAPRMLPDLGRAIGQCFASSTGVRRAIADVGPEPPGRSLRDSLTEAARQHVRLGYRPRGTPQRGTLRPREAARLAVRLAADRCYALVARGGSHALDLDMLVRAPGMRAVARDTTRKRDARVRFCTRSGGRHLVEVRMYEGMGDWALQVFELEELRPERRPVGLRGRARIPFAELRARMQRRGMHASPMAWGQIAPRRSLSMPVQLQAGRCYAFGGVPSESLLQGDLDLVLVDDTGAVRAWDLGTDAAPLLFHCPRTDGIYRIIGKAFGARGAYLVLGGSSDAAGGAQ